MLLAWTHGKASAIQPTALTLSIDSLHQINCLRATGYVSVSATGGTAPYTYLWSNGYTGTVAGDLIAGSYSIVVTDAVGATASTNVVIIEDLALPFADAGTDATTLCDNTVASLAGNGPSGPGFTYVWTPSNGGIIQSGGNTLIPVVHHAGTYTLLITNTQNGCTASDAVVVSGTHPAPSANATGGTIKCSPASVVLGATYTVLNTTFGWSGPGGFQSPLQNPVVAIPGAYTFTVTDTLTGCITPAIATVSIDTVKPTVTATGGTITCNQPVITLGGTGLPVTVGFAWSGPNGFTSSLQNPQTSVPGLYTLTVTNPQNSCSKSAAATVVSNTTPPSASATVNGSLSCSILSVSVSGSSNTPGASYAWTGPGGFIADTQNIAVAIPGTYFLTVKNPVNGCIGTTSATVTSNTTPPGVTATGGVKTCSNPSVTLHANSNTGGITYSWTGPGNFTSSQANPVVSVAGAYFITVTNPVNGCTSTALTTVTQNITPPQLSTNSVTITCSNPMPLLVASSIVSNAMYSWTGPNGFTANISNPPVSAGGLYTVTATNPVNGCTSSAVAFATENNTVPYVYAGDDRTLNCNFSIIVMNPVGTLPASNQTYLWTTFDGHIVSGANGLYAKVDAPGTYTLTVKNTLTGCMGMDSMDVTQSPPVTAAITENNSVSCNGGSNGSAKVTSNGGNPPFTFSWSNSGQNATNSNLTAGVYTVTVTDEEGCSATATATITQPGPLLSAIMSTPQTMVNVNNGTASVSPSGGTPPYTVKWSNLKISQTIDNLSPGTYSVTVTDFKGCTIVKTTTVNAVNCNLAGAIASTNITCSGANNGSATANITGANGTIVYQWSNAGTTKTLSGLAPGTYTVTATDAGGCSLVLNTQITSPLPLVVSIVSQTNVLCGGVQNGAATLGASGGTSPYTYAWSSGSQTATASGLAAGSYTCTVTDTKGCSKVQSVQITSTDNTPPQLVLKNATVSINSSGLAVVTPAIFDNGSTDVGCGIATWTVVPSTFNCNQIGMHVVTLTATDQNGNSATGTATVNVKDEIVPLLICPLDQTVSACSSLVAYNIPQILDNCSQTGAPVLLGGLVSGSSFPVGATTQTYSYTDPGGNSSVCSFTVTVTGAFSFEVSSTPVSCAGACNGSATVVASGDNQIVDYHWSSGQHDSLITALCPGLYTVTVTDATGCSQSQTISISTGNNPPFSFTTTVKPAGCAGLCDGSIQLNITGNTSPVAVLWSNNQSGNISSGLCPGSYTATLTDAAGCSQTQSAQIIVQDTQIPVVTCQNSVSTGYCNSAITFAPAQVTDNCTVDPQQIQLITGLPSGSVFPIGVTIQTYRYTDSGGNVGQCTFMVTVHTPPAVSVAASNVSCAGECDGLATLSVNGGQGPFNILWDNGLSGLTNPNLCAGSYAATLTDGDGCVQIKSVNITQPQVFQIATDQVTNNTGVTGTGSILISASGGTAPYTYSWSLNGQFYSTGEDIQNLFAGQYAVTATDAKGCTAILAPLTVNGLVDATEPGADANWALYPNPASTEVTLDLKDFSGNGFRLGIYDPSGRLLYEQSFTTTQTNPVRIDLSDMPDGALLFRLVHERGTTVKTLIKIRG